MGDCTVGKELKQSTCRYVKKCKPGWVRNNKFICRKTLRRKGKQSKNSPTGIIKQLFGTPSSSPNNKNLKFTNKELVDLFDSPEEEFNLNLEPRRVKAKSRTAKPRNVKPRNVKQRTVKPRNVKQRTVKPKTNAKPLKTNQSKAKQRKTNQSKAKQRTSKKEKPRITLNNLQNSPNVQFDLKKFKRASKSRLQKTSDLKRREQIKQREREGMNRHARKIAKTYNV